MDNNIKETIRENRILTMSTNRKLDCLCVDAGIDKTTIVGIINTKSTIDVVFIKTIYKQSFQNIAEQIYDIFLEFGMPIIRMDTLGMSKCLYDILNAMHLLCMEIKPSKLSNSKAIYSFIKDVQEGKLRLLQSLTNARNSYKNTFLGYSEIINSHRETDELIKEIDNLKIEDVNGNICIKQIDNNINIDRFRCLILKYIPFEDKK